MIETVLNNSWSAPLSSLPTYGVMIVSAPIVGFCAIKVLLLAKAASGDKKAREWVFMQERDENGMPVLAPVKVRSFYPRIPRSR